MVSSFLFALILGGVVKVVQEGLRYFTVQSISLDIQQQSLLAMKWLTDELADGSLESLKVYSSPRGLIFGNPRGGDGALQTSHGTVLWRRFICYYVDQVGSDSVLIRKERALTVPAMAPPPVPSELKTASFRADSTQPRIVARYVSSLTADVSANPVKLVLDTDYGQGSFTLKIQTEVRLREEEDQ